MTIVRRAMDLAALATLFAPVLGWAAAGDLLWQREIPVVAGCPQLEAREGRVFVYWLANDFTGRPPVPRLRAFNMEDGRLLWKSAGTPGYEPGGIGSPAIAAGAGTVYTSEGIPGSKFERQDVAAVSARDSTTGRVLWHNRLDDESFHYYLSAIAADNDAVYAVGTRYPEIDPGQNGVRAEVMIFAWDGATGQLRWSDFFNLGGGFDAGYHVVALRGLTVVSIEQSTPRGRSTGVIRAYRSASGRLLWSQETRIDQLYDLDGHRDQVFVVGRAKGGQARNSLAVALDLWTGQVLWERRIKNYLQMRSIDTAGRTTLVYGVDTPSLEARSTIRAFDRKTGRFLWRHDEIGAYGLQIEASRGRGYSIGWLDPGFGMSLNSYRARSGEPRWSYPPATPEAEDAGCQSIVSRNKLMAVSGDGVRGFLRAFEP